MHLVLPELLDPLIEPAAPPDEEGGPPGVWWGALYTMKAGGCWIPVRVITPQYAVCGTNSIGVGILSCLGHTLLPWSYLFILYAMKACADDIA